MNELRLPGSSPSGRRSERRIVDGDLFRFLIDLEIGKAGRLRYSVSVVCLAPDFPGKLNQLFQKRLVKGVLSLLRATDIVAVFAENFLGLLLVDADPQSLPSIVARVKNELDAMTAASGEQGPRRTWSGGGASYPETATSGAHLLRQAFDLMVRARAEGGDRFYLPADPTNPSLRHPPGSSR
jgi:hypothetical protein